MAGLQMERSQCQIGMAPIADFAAGDTYSDVISMKNHARLLFVVMWGVGTTGTIKFTVNACDDVVPTTEAAIPFHYRVTAGAGIPGAITATTASTGFTNTAGSAQIVEIEVRSEELNATGYDFVRLKLDEVTDDPILGGVLVQLLDPIHHGNAFTAAVS